MRFSFFSYCKNNKLVNDLAALLVAYMLILALPACKNEKPKAQPLFKTLTAEKTGLSFSNILKPTQELNLITYMYYYNGAGVGAGDFNNDGLTDLFFSANQGENKLFLNKGQLQFKDVTKAASIPQDSGWSTGVSVVDINNDGLLDIYICRVGHYKSLLSKNQLLICQGLGKDSVPFYADEAAAYGLDFSGFSTQATFFDYDGDRDLDMFLLNHSVNHDGNYAPRENFINTFDSLAGQKLFRNESKKNNAGKKVSFFIEVTKAAGINGSRIGYGLGVAVADINLDGWPDFYVGNDFHEDDYLYINQKNGTFKESGAQQLMHTSQFSMGVDVADINNDAWPEIVSLDMLPYEPYMLRRSLAEDDYNIFMQKIKYGYTWQYARNNLQLNMGNGSFCEVGQYAGIHATDWSWGSLWMDFDNDGYKDIFISNGIPKRMNDIDYINFISDQQVQQQLQSGSIQEKEILLNNKFPEIKIPNQFFRNTGNIKFENITDAIADNQPSFSNGCINADLDNDGDMDIVVNNINDPVMVYENTANNEKLKPSIAISLKGAGENINAIGAKIILFSNDKIHMYENFAVHGFQSSMVCPLVVGASNVKMDSVFLIWPDNTFKKIALQPGKNYSYTYEQGLPLFNYAIVTNFTKRNSFNATDITAQTGISHLHEENVFNEFDREPLMPHMVSTEGPALAVADINHDGLEDFFVGASKTFKNVIYIQQPGGTFNKTTQPSMDKDSMWENVAAVWADVNNDSHIDLIIATGGNEFYGGDEHQLPLLYINDGKANFTRKEDAFENIFQTQSTIAPYDFDKDGFVDLFIGCRTVPWNYGKTPPSFLLRNDGTGKFTDVTKKYIPQLASLGMITNAVWFDMNKDGDTDLLLCHEWGSVDVLLNKKTYFERKVLTDKKGWWNFVLPFDADGDGDYDIIVGNAGQNNKFNVTDKLPLHLYYNDFDGNGIYEQIFSYYVGGTEIPFSSKMELEKRLPYIKKDYLYAADFAKTSLFGLFGEDKIKKATQLTADYLSNAILINNGNLNFEVKTLPTTAQLSAYRTAAIVNANADNLPDVLLGGNFYENNVQAGRFDGDYGTLLINKGKGAFAAENLNGLVIKGQVRQILPININKKQAFVLAKNNDSLQVIQFSNN
jgi:enediyne biosynthesis protein E4